MSSINQPDLSGTGVALVTPFRQHAIDYEALAGLIDYVIAGGVDYIVCLGTTGEAITLTRQECREVLSFTIEKVGGRAPIVAGFFGSNYTEQLVESLRTYDFSGVAAIMSSSPSYNRPTQEGLFRHYMAVAEASPLPIVIYNVPSRTACNVEAATVVRLAQASPKFVAVKEASGNMGQVMQLLKNRPEHLLVLSGDDPLTLPIMACGGHGAISVIANALPGPFSAMVNALKVGDLATARRLNHLLLDVHPPLYAEGNPAGVKGALEALGLCSREVRLPLAPLSDETFGKLQQLLHEAGAAL
jgi:4-hydroxy-tetrahydrodipicolinate synthase